jgi:hypothetical protein
MGHTIVIVVAVLFGVVAAGAIGLAARERSAAGTAGVGDPPPAAGTPRDRWNKRLTLAAVSGTICVIACIALALGR